MVVAYIPGRLGSIYLLQDWLGADAIWWSFPIGGAFSLLLTLAYYLHGGWRNIQLLATVEEAEEFVQSECEPTGRILPNG